MTALHRTRTWVRSHRATIAYWVALLVVAAVLAASINAIVSLYERADAGRADRADLRAELERSRADASALAEQVQGLGAEPVVTPDAPVAPVEPGPQGAQGDQGSRGVQGEQGPGPSPGQVAAAVAAYCAGDRCSAPPSDGQVTAAVVAYCAAGTCTGRPGSVGQDGPAGRDGAAGQDGAVGPQGAPGPAPTAEQVRAAVDAYCTEVGCTGPPGEPGLTGPPGRGITALACESTPLTGTTRITVTYDDGTTRTVDCA